MARSYNGETATYDARGKMYIGGDSLVYAPLGALWYSNNGSVIEAYEPDVLGNSHRTDVSGPDLPPKQPKFASYHPASNMLLQEIRANGRYADTTNYDYDGIKGMLRSTDVKTVADTLGGISGAGDRWQHRKTSSHYDGQAQLDSTQFKVDTILPSNGSYFTDYVAIELYRYDALNRRIWMRNIRGPNCDRQDKSSGCRSNLRRTIWDGDQILYEIQVKGDSTSTFLEKDNYQVAPFYGTVAYTHGIGIDAPLALYKVGTSTMVAPRQDMSGKFVGGTCHPGGCGSPPIFWPEADGSQFSILGTAPLGPPSWYGSIIEGGQDASGYQYKRNRYYDPQTGKFTQEDPIGLAGGLNAYGFANGDPVNFSDPFGLCPIPASDCPPGYFTAALGTGGAVVGGIAGGVAGGVVSVPTLGLTAPATIPGGILAGSASGLATGAFVGSGLDVGVALSKTELGKKLGRAIRRIATAIALGAGLRSHEAEQTPEIEDPNKHKPPPAAPSGRSVSPLDKDRDTTPQTN